MSVATVGSATTRQLGNCANCDAQLPLRFAGPGEQPKLWLCAKCGARYVGVIDESSSPECLNNIVAEAEAPAKKPEKAQQPSRPSCLGSPQQPVESTKSVPSDRQDVRATVRNEFTDAFDATIANGEPMTSEPRGPAFSERVAPHGAAPFDPQAVDSAVSGFNDSLWQVTDLFAALENCQEPDLPSIDRISQATLESAAGDLDLLTSIGISSSTQDYPTRHSLQVSNLAVAIGVALGFDEWKLQELSTGCLLHDLGMLKVERQVWQTNKQLQQAEFAPIANHPCDSVAMLGQYLDKVPFSTRMVVYQTHERINGSGYPRGCKGPHIHELAKVAAVADTFVALVSPRPHRKAQMPYHAMAKLLDDVKKGLYDAKVVRALLRTTSLFPLGSYVLLSDNRIARVLRSNGEKFTQPVVEAWTPSNRQGHGDIIDLANGGELQIIEPLAKLP